MFKKEQSKYRISLCGNAVRIKGRVDTGDIMVIIERLKEHKCEDSSDSKLDIQFKRDIEGHGSLGDNYYYSINVNGTMDEPSRLMIIQRLTILVAPTTEGYYE